jgi:hypothetical protein
MLITVFVQSGLPEMVSRTLLRPLAIALHTRVLPSHFLLRESHFILYSIRKLTGLR